MYTAKHLMFVSDSMENKSVYDLPGIGQVRGGRLESVGIRTASQLASLYKRMGRDEFESFLNRTCGQNSRWTGMTIMALDEHTKANVPSVGFIPQQKSTSTISMSQKATASNFIHSKDDEPSELSEEIASLRLEIQRLRQKMGYFDKEIISKIKKLSDIVEVLQTRIELSTRTNNALGDKINSNQLKIIELNAKSDKLMDFTEKIASFELDLRQTEETLSGLCNKRTGLEEQQQQLTKLFVENECMQKYNETSAEAIKELNNKMNKLKTNTIDLATSVAMKSEEFAHLTDKMNSFESRYQISEEANRKLIRKLQFIYGTNAVLIIVSTFLLVKNIT